MGALSRQLGTAYIGTGFRGGGGGSTKKAHTQAAKAASLFVKQHTDDGGDVNDPEVYRIAIEKFGLQSLADSGDVDAQIDVAEYTNKIKELGKKNLEQEITVAQMRRDVEDALIVKHSEKMRKPQELALLISEQLDQQLLGIEDAMNYYESKNQKYDKIKGYYDEVSKLASAQRGLVDKMMSGTLNPESDDFGYYIQQDGTGGAITGASILPTSLAPSSIAGGTKRVVNTVDIGGSRLPVYLPTTIDAEGNSVARFGGDTWTGNGQAALEHVSGDAFSDPNAFFLDDTTRFPKKTFSLESGQFAKKVLGAYQDGSTRYGYYYRGADKKLYSLDEQSFEQIRRSDPMLTERLSTYIPTIGSEESKTLGVAEPMTPSSSIIKVPYGPPIPEYGPPVPQMSSAPSLNMSPAPRISQGGVNTPNKPDTSRESNGPLTLAGEVIEKGKSFFRNIFG